jgi:predicted transcriptional regulator of viral defense system
MNKTNYTQLYNNAEAQAGYFSAAQAKAAGFSYERLSDLASRGKFQRKAQGVYRIFHFPHSRFEDLHIASLRTGADSVVSHDSALSVYDISDIMPTKTHVTIPINGSRKGKDYYFHTNKLEADDITTREGLRITTVERTIADSIVGGISYEHARQAIKEALRRGLTTKDRLHKYCNKRGGIASKVIIHVLEE